jgi:hypothetical protein
MCVDFAWTLSDGFCVIYRYEAHPDVRLGYRASYAGQASEFLDPVEWGESVAAELWNGPPSEAELTRDDQGVGWHGQIGSGPPAIPT